MERTEEERPWHDDEDDAELSSYRLRVGESVRLWSWFHGSHYRKVGSPDKMYLIGDKPED